MTLTSCGASNRIVVAEAGGADVDILAQFELETKSPVPEEPDGSAARIGPSQIDHPDPLELTDIPIEIASDRTSAALTTAIAKQFRDDGFRGTVESSLSDEPTVYAQLCDQLVHMGIVSREPSQAELQGCAVELVVLPVARDRLVVAAHPDNFWIGDIVADDLTSLAAATSWSDIDDSWPSRPLTKYLPPLGSNEMNLLLESVDGPTDATASDFPGAVFEAEVDERLRHLASDSAGISVVPLVAVRRSALDFVERSLTARDPLLATFYPAERSLHVVVARSAVRSSPELATFVAYFLNRTDLEAPKQHLVVDADLADTREAFVNLADDLGLRDGLLPLLAVAVEDA